MAVYLKATKIVNEHEYNQSLTDAKVDFILDELALERKVTVGTDIVLPTIVGAVDIELTIPVDEESLDWLDGVTAVDEQQGDVTESLVADDSDVNLLAGGTYDLVYSAFDADGNEAQETVEVTIIVPTFTVTYNLNGGNIGGDTADVVVADVPYGTLVGSAYTGGTPVLAANTWTTPYWVTTAEGSTDAASEPVTANVTVYAYWVLT